MLGKIFEELPAPLFLALCCYAVLCWVLAPEVVRRRLEPEMPACQAGIRAAEAAQHRLLAEKDAAVRGLEELLRMYDALPGGKVMAAYVRSQIAAAKGGATPTADAAAHCRCLIEATATDMNVRTDTALFIGSLRLIEENGVRNVKGHLARREREGVCGKAVP